VRARCSSSKPQKRSRGGVGPANPGLRVDEPARNGVRRRALDGLPSWISWALARSGPGPRATLAPSSGMCTRPMFRPKQRGVLTRR
jgi:hypothetical protein